MHGADPGEGLAAELDESAEPLLWVGERADLVPAVLLVALPRILRVVSGHRQDAFQQALLAAEGDVDRVGGHAGGLSHRGDPLGRALLQPLHRAAAGPGRPGLVASLTLFEPAKPSGTQREVAAWTFGPAEAARVAAPALLPCGAHSRPWFRENVAILAEMLPDARTQSLPELDHLAALRSPTPTNSPPPSANSSATQHPRPPDRSAGSRSTCTRRRRNHISSLASGLSGRSCSAAHW